MDPINFNIYESTDLCSIMRKHCSDKGHPNINNAWHNYTLYYTQRFKNIKPKRIFELGLGSNNPNIPSNMGPAGVPGASLFGWSEYYPDAKVYGADIDYECLFSTEKIKTFYCDQLNPLSIKKLWQQYELLEGFDIIIDDGCHTFDGIVTFFENSIHKLRNIQSILTCLIQKELNIEILRLVDIGGIIVMRTDYRHHLSYRIHQFRILRH